MSPAPIVLRTPEEVRFSAPELLDLGLSSGVSVFVPGADRPFGVLWAFSTQERIFSPDDVHFLVSVANVLAAALLRHRARLRLEELVRSKEVGQPSSVGLGLTVSRKLAHLMGGSLTYRNDDGSTFELVLQPTPRAAEITMVDEGALGARPA